MYSLNAHSLRTSLPSRHTMTRHIDPETGILVVGVGIAFFVLLALVTPYLQPSTSISRDKFSLTPYLKFAYVSFIKPHTGEVGNGQQSALESFYAAQVSPTATKTSFLLMRSRLLCMMPQEKNFCVAERIFWDV